MKFHPSMIKLGVVLSSVGCFAASDNLEFKYFVHSSQGSDIYEHLPILAEISQECESVTEIGVRSAVSTWGILKGLADSPFEKKQYLGIDLDVPYCLDALQALSEDNQIQYEFLQANDMTIDIPETDFLFIDSLHTYCHLTYELEKFSSKARKYIAMHDTSPPWENQDDNTYHGNYSEYPSHFDKTKRGLWPAVVDFLEKHPEWKIKERRTNCHGFTILERV